jgi:hypothetical protein
VEFKGADQDSTTVPGYLPAHFFPMRIFFGVTEEVKNPNLTADTVLAGMYGLWP